MNYRMLVLPNSTSMTPELLDRLSTLANAGALILGSQPKSSPSLSGMPGAAARVSTAAASLWGTGNIIVGKTPEQVLAARGIVPDFRADRVLNWIHRRIGAADVYFVANGNKNSVNATCDFRVTRKAPELWHPVTGRTEPVAAWIEGKQTTRLTLALEPGGSVFVVFQPYATRPDPVVKIARGTRVVWPPVARAAHLRITRALWGPAGDARRTKDVTDQVQRMVDRVGPSFTVAELASEGDPAVNVVKTLRVDYEVGGKVTTVSATDPEVITFEVPGDASSPLRLSMDARGKLTAMAGAEGAYTVTRRSGKTERFTSAAPPRAVTVAGPWTVCFPPKWGAPGSVVLDRLTSLSEHSDEGVRYFSGTATYTATFKWNPSPPSPLPAAGANRAYSSPILSEERGKAVRRSLGRRVYLDLGRVEVMAQVRLNGKDLGTLWRTPYEVDVTTALKPGANTLGIRVTNLWINRMIGDEHLPEDSERHGNGTLVEWPAWLSGDGPSPTGRYTFTSWRLWGKDSPLQPSGLIGPVTLCTEVKVAPR